MCSFFSGSVVFNTTEPEMDEPALTAAIGGVCVLLVWWYYFKVLRKDYAVCVVEACKECDATTCQGVKGSVFLQKEGTHRTRLIFEVHGLAPGLHGAHAHSSGNFTHGCSGTCSHYNPDHSVHGGPLGPRRHRGDFGNIVADEHGTSDTVVVVDTPLHELVGRALILHEGADDLGRGGDAQSSITGNAGARVGGGVIEWFR